MRGSEEGGVIMREEEKKGVYFHSTVCQRGADEGGENGEGGAVQDSEASSDSRKRPYMKSAIVLIFKGKRISE